MGLPGRIGGRAEYVETVEVPNLDRPIDIPLRADAEVSLPAVGTGIHTLQMTFIGNRILVYYDGIQKIDVTDNNFDSRPPYSGGGISADWYSRTLCWIRWG